MFYKDILVAEGRKRDSRNKIRIDDSQFSLLLQALSTSWVKPEGSEAPVRIAHTYFQPPTRKACIRDCLHPIPGGGWFGLHNWSPWASPPPANLKLY